MSACRPAVDDRPVEASAGLPRPAVPAAGDPAAQPTWRPPGGVRPSRWWPTTRRPGPTSRRGAAMRGQEYVGEGLAADGVRSWSAVCWYGSSTTATTAGSPTTRGRSTSGSATGPGPSTPGCWTRRTPRRSRRGAHRADRLPRQARDALESADLVVAGTYTEVEWTKQPGTTYLQTWHGTPLKRIHHDVLLRPAGRLDKPRPRRRPLGRAALPQPGQHPPAARGVRLRRRRCSRPATRATTCSSAPARQPRRPASAPSSGAPTTSARCSTPRPGATTRTTTRAAPTCRCTCDLARPPRGSARRAGATVLLARCTT